MDEFEKTFNQIKQFMQTMDRNGDWLTATIDDAQLILNTILDWSENDGLVITPSFTLIFLRRNVE